jgi:hypothetical protein
MLGSILLWIIAWEDRNFGINVREFLYVDRAININI